MKTTSKKNLFYVLSIVFICSLPCFSEGITTYFHEDEVLVSNNGKETVVLSSYSYQHDTNHPKFYWVEIYHIDNETHTTTIFDIEQINEEETDNFYIFIKRAFESTEKGKLYPLVNLKFIKGFLDDFFKNDFFYILSITQEPFYNSEETYEYYLYEIDYRLFLDKKQELDYYSNAFIAV